MLRPKIVPVIGFSGFNCNTLVRLKYYSQLSNLKARHSCARAAPTPIHLASIGSCRPQFSTMSPDSTTIEYRWIPNVERLELYEPGGYHPVVIDDVLQNRYRIVDKLGFGGYSTIWLARDEVDQRYVAVKIGISTPLPSRKEVQILEALNSSRSSLQDARPSSSTEKRAGASALPTILDTFDIRGPNGTHPYYTLIPAQRDLKEASFSCLFPVQVARSLAVKLAIAVTAVHSRGFVHGVLSYHLPLYLDSTAVFKVNR